MAELWYRLKEIPDLTLNKYGSLEGRGVDGVIEKHIAFLRQLNRKGIVSGLSFHLYYLYIVPEDKTKDLPGHRLHIFFMVRGNTNSMGNVPALMSASPLSDFYKLESKLKGKSGDASICNIENILSDLKIDMPVFNTCAFLTKAETKLTAGNGDGEEYYMLRDWKMNDDGRLYNMCKMMEAINHTALYRVDLYPVEKSASLRDGLKKPLSILRRKQDERGSISKKDYETIPPYGETKHVDSIILGAGESISDSYIINSMLAKQGKQADVYLAKKWGKNYVVKHYHGGWKPSGKIKDFLSNVRHPNIAHVLENGIYGERYYEIYEHYSNGTLEEAGALPINYIQNVIVPSINEGLHERGVNCE